LGFLETESWPETLNAAIPKRKDKAVKRKEEDGGELAEEEEEETNETE
jgi:hypothetical protein